MSLRKFTKEKRSALLDDYIVFIQKREIDIGVTENDLINFYPAIKGSNSYKWINTTNEKIKSIRNDI